MSAVKRALDRAGDGPVILVGHSWGGVVITASGTDERVKGLVMSRRLRRTRVRRPLN